MREKIAGKKRTLEGRGDQWRLNGWGCPLFKKKKSENRFWEGKEQLNKSRQNTEEKGKDTIKANGNKADSGSKNRFFVQ